MSDQPRRLMTQRCEVCDTPAGWVARQQYWCDEHVPPADGYPHGDWHMHINPKHRPEASA